VSASLSREYPCSLIRAVLLPGHGTIVGDTLKMKYEDWQGIVRYGVNSFKKDKRIADLYLVGFSTGTSLSIDYMKDHPVAADKVREDKIKGLVLLSVAVKAKSKKARLAPFVAWFKDWEAPTYEEKDAARYESFSYNAGAQFYKLTADMASPEYALHVPVLMAVSADDETINANAAREFFCYRSSIKRRALVWYQSIDPEKNASINQEKTPELMCNNILEVKLDTLDPQFKTVNLAHTSLAIQPEDPHYGLKGKYRSCKTYTKPQEFSDCQADLKNNIFGEINVPTLREGVKPNYDYLRRGTFNPDYKNLEARIFCFTNEQCSTSTLLKH
jgi:esterase/lipase